MRRFLRAWRLTDGSSPVLPHWENAQMIIRAAREEDTPGLIALAMQVEHWFGPMAAEPGFQAALTRHISRGTALTATTNAQTDPLGGLLFTAKPRPTTCAGSSSPRTHAGQASAAP